MKTSVTKIMMSFALMGCLIFSASDAMAQGRSRSQGGSTSSRSQSAAVSRSNSSSAPTVSRSSSSSSMSRSSSSSISHSSSATPQVNRSSSSSSSMGRSSSTTTQVNRGSSSSTKERSLTTTPQVNNSSTSSRPSSGATIRGGNSDKRTTTTSGSSTTIRRSDSGMSGTLDKTTKTDRSTSVVGTGTTDNRLNGNRPGGTKPNGGNGGNGKPDNGGKPNGSNGGHDNNGGKPNGGNGGGHDNQGGRPNGGNGGGHDNQGGRPNGGGHGGHSGYDTNNHFDYTNHHYHNDFHHNYTHHSWSWSRPLPPPARPYRPAFRTWYRPVIPAGWYPYAGAPIIDRILGITFGTLFNTSIDYLYYNGYEIDGYADHIIYLRDVPLLNLIWDDVMLGYDSMDRLVNAQFVYMTSSISNKRYDRVYRKLCRLYGTPFSNSDGSLSWYGGNNTGWITLSTYMDLGNYYTTLSIGY